MTKKDLIDKVAMETDITITLAKQVVEKTLDLIGKQLNVGGSICLTNFGTFQVTKRRAPKTAEGHRPPARVGVSFKPSPNLKNQITT